MKKKIMVVDDEENLVELTKAVFEREGFEVVHAYDGKECLEKLKVVHPDLILMDVKMPGMSGKETTEKIRANPKTKNLKIVFLTVAKFSEIGKDALEKTDALDYITKPFDNDDLVRRVKKLI